MTREEAIAELKCSIELTHFDPFTGETSEWLNEENQRYVDACNMAIEALEHEPILDKIRAEIMAIGNWSTKSELPNGYLVKVLEIIDKYKAESEDKE